MQNWYIVIVRYYSICNIKKNLSYTPKYCPDVFELWTGPLDRSNYVQKGPVRGPHKHRICGPGRVTVQSNMLGPDLDRTTATLMRGVMVSST